LPSGTAIYEVLALDEARDTGLLETGRLFFRHSRVFLREELR